VWLGSWASSQQIPETPNALPADDLQDATLRQIVHLSVGGSQLRVHVSNDFGTTPLHLSAVHIARPVAASTGQIDPATDTALKFSGSPDVTIPAGAEYISDPVSFPAAALSDLAITLHIEHSPAQQTSHPGSRQTSFLVHGDAISAASLPDAKRVEHWFFLSGVDVQAPAHALALVTLGDSITDGHGATTNGNDRWPDILAQRLQASPASRSTSVLNHGIGGNHLLTDGLGPNALSRFNRDVLAQPGVRVLLLLEGVNDLGGLAREGEVAPERHEALVRAMIGACEQMIARAHDHGIKVIGATIMPYVGSDYYKPTPANEADRLRVNAWIRASGHFDAVVDFDRVTADPKQPDHLLPAYDSGDHLHPSPAGYRAMAESIPLSLFAF
jgi:lysophospholipase L1-like esterase